MLRTGWEALTTSAFSLSPSELTGLAIAGVLTVATLLYAVVKNVSTSKDLAKIVGKRSEP